MAATCTRALRRPDLRAASKLLPALGAALVLGGCSRLLPGSLRCPDRGGPAWRVATSEHFLVYSDLDHGDVAAVVRQLEAVRATELAVMTEGGVEVEGRLRVVVPASELTFRDIAPPGALGYYLVTGLGEPTMVLHAGAMRRDPEVFAHELAHFLSWHLYARQPRWFSEGLAQYVQTVASPAEDGRAWAGRVPRIRRGQCERLRAVPARALLGWTQASSPTELATLELWSWVLYHWLWSERPAALAEYQRRLAADEAAAAAWAAAVPDLDPAGDLGWLDEALRRHCGRADLPARPVVARASGDAFREAPLASADVHVLLNEARGYFETGRRAFRAADAPRVVEEGAELELKEALEEDPFQPRAVSRMADLEGRAAAPGLRLASQARPDDWSAWFLLGDALEDEDDLVEAEAAYRRAAALNPDHAPTQNNLAWLLGNAGRAAEARPFAERAVALAPWDPNVLDTLALVLDGLGRCPDALRWQRRAVDHLAAGGPLRVMTGENPGEIRERLAAYQARCGDGARPQAARP